MIKIILQQFRFYVDSGKAREPEFDEYTFSLQVIIKVLLQ